MWIVTFERLLRRPFQRCPERKGGAGIAQWLLTLVFQVILGDLSSDLCYSLCVYRPYPMSYPPMAVIIINTMMTLEYLTVHHLVISLLLSPTFKPA